jgi:hypothetical protein
MLSWERDPKKQSLSNDHGMKTKVLLLSSCSRCIQRIAILAFAIALPIATAASVNPRLTPADVLSVNQGPADYEMKVS